MAGKQQSEIYDIFIIGGGVNGCGIARDAAGRGLSVALAEMNDLASATSSASTKLFHGGLRYLEYFEFSLVRKALIEREILLRNMPHISWPMRFVLPYHRDMRFEGDTPTSKLLSVFMPWLKGQRPACLIRAGLFLYDHLGGRNILPATRLLDLNSDLAGKPLKAKFKKAFEYSDCGVEDARLVALNARDAHERGAKIMTRAEVTRVSCEDRVWKISIKNIATDEESICQAKALVNAGGPWVGKLLTNTIGRNSSEGVRLVRGSHIVTRKLYDHDRCYFFQGEDGRIIFAIPYEEDYTMIGTTDQEHEGDPGRCECTQEEIEYLLKFASNYFADPVTEKDIIWSFSGVRPLYDDGVSSVTAATRDYVLSVDASAGATLLSVFGGKITTYRRLAEGVMAKLNAYFPKMESDWTAKTCLPGGDFKLDEFENLITALRSRHSFVDERWARRMVRAYGTDAQLILNDASSLSDLGKNFGASLTEAEVRWLIEREFARSADDVVWRRSKLGLRMSDQEIGELDAWIKSEGIQNENSVAAQ